MTKIDPQNKQVHLQDSRVVAYDVLVIATGAECPFPAQSGKVSTAESNEAYGQYLERVCCLMYYNVLIPITFSIHYSFFKETIT